MVTDLGCWKYYNPVWVSFGTGLISKLQTLIPGQGRLLLVTTPGFTKRGLTKHIVDQLGPHRTFVYDQVLPNPELDALDTLTDSLRPEKFDLILGLGGGSVIDTAKVLGITLRSKQKKPLDQVLRRAYKKKWNAQLPVTTIPTTAGSGAEVTPFATVWDSVNQKKHSIADEYVFPVHALLDPELTLTLPFRETLYCGLDAIAHALESIWNKNKTPVSQAMAVKSLEYAKGALPIILKEPRNLEKRTQMQYASLLAGFAISQTRTAIAHSISYPLTIHFNMPHGLACGFVLPAIIRMIQNKGLLDEYDQLLNDILRMLESFSLNHEVQLYACQKGAITEYINEMFTQNRADNFILDMCEDEMRALIKSTA